MPHLILSGDNTAFPGFSLLDETNLEITLDDTGTLGFALSFLVLSGPRSVSIASMGTTGGFNKFPQLEEIDGDLRSVFITGSEPFFLGAATGNANSGDGVVTDIAAKANNGVPSMVPSKLTLIDASVATGQVNIFAGATNKSSAGSFENGGKLNANVAIQYNHLEIKGGSGTGDHIENDAKKGIVIDGNGNGDTVVLGGADAEATVGTGTGDSVAVGLSGLGLTETAGSALDDTVKFGSASTATLSVSQGAEAGVIGNTHNLTKVLDAEAGMLINFTNITTSSNIVDETAKVASKGTLTAAENAAVDALGVPGVAYFKFEGNEYFIATNHAETAVSAGDAIVELVGITNIHNAHNISGMVTLA